MILYPEGPDLYTFVVGGLFHSTTTVDKVR